MPVFSEFIKFLVAYTGLLISCDDLLCLFLGLLTEKVDELLCLAGRKSDIGLECAAGVAVIVEALTDNSNRTTSSVRSTFDKYGGNLGTPGCVSYMFNSKGVLVIDNEDGDLDEDTVMDAALEAGADDMVNEGDSFVIYTDPADFADVLSGMKEAGYEFVEADIEKVPTMEATPKPEDLKRLSKMLNLLEENEDVQKVHHNCAVELLDE